MFITSSASCFACRARSMENWHGILPAREGAVGLLSCICTDSRHSCPLSMGWLGSARPRMLPWPGSLIPRADRSLCWRGALAAAHRHRAAALPHSSSRSSSLQMQALLWLFMKGRQPRVQTALNTVSAMDSQAVGKDRMGR